mmetsp:Transcript_14718/g.21932  ORF Transcript_14718/g.21932 Transcript_14718/m.21932 type:complete len:448 (-) Transcript_14718:448-1791(-)
MLRVAASSSVKLQQRIVVQKSSSSAAAAAAVHNDGLFHFSSKNNDEDNRKCGVNSTNNGILPTRRHFTVGSNNLSTVTLLSLSSSSAISKRSMSTTTSASAAGGDLPTPNPTFEETMSKLIPSPSKPIPAEDEVAAELAARAAQAWDPVWYNPPDQVINVINKVHEITDLSYGLTIVGLTLGFRTLMFPLFVKSQQNVARMAHMRPEMDVLKAKIDKMGGNPDTETQMKHGMEMKALFKKYNCNPFKSLMLPIVQAPIFMSFFFGLRKMPDYFPEELSTGGFLWFPDLGGADPYCILPVISAGSFLLMMELGKDQMMASNPEQGRMMMTFFRALGIIMVPATMNFSTAVFCYWTTNNTFSLCQSIAFRNKTVRKKLDIWDPPKPVPGAKSNDKGIVESIKDSFRQSSEKQDKQSMADQIKKHNEMIEQKKVERNSGKGGRRRQRGKK